MIAGSDGEAAPSSFFLPPPIRGIRAAFVFFTRLPAGGFPYRAEDHSWAVAHAPLVGSVVGAIGAAVFRALQPLGPSGAAVLSVSAMVAVTGALHEDGLADTADALGGGATRERILSILKDSRIGAYGAVALFVSLGTRVTLIAHLEESALWALPLASAMARVVPAWLVRALPYARPPEASKSVDIVRGSGLRAFMAALWGALFLFAAVSLRLCSPQRAAVLVATLVAVGMAAARLYRGRLGGITGDLLGAAEQVSEMAALAVLAWRS